MEAQVFTSRFVKVLPSVYKAKAAFLDVFGDMQAVDGVSETEVAMQVKVNDLPTVIGQYSTDPNVAFGTGTAKSSRFGEMQEIIYQNKSVPFDLPWAIHKGLDQFTVNADMDTAVADALRDITEARIREVNRVQGAYLVAHAGKDLGAATDVVALFEKADIEMTELEVDAPLVAFVSAKVYNAIIDSNLATTAKQSGVNVDANTIVEFKGFKIVKVPSAYLGGKEVIFAPAGVGREFVGLEVLRTLEGRDFVGVILQGAGKGGRYISDANFKAVMTAGTAASSN
ncbi:major head protein [Weissella phage WCP30]|uniref:major head protein n=1 Tax=Weissella phage WCP30 TaxID=1837862 RepID=UPI000810FBE5|nr:major head protein [Weissella phage WCP30]ANU78870.1 major capsid protein [Weissella phage WCP30]